MRISFITTVFNEEKTIRQFLNSLNGQIKQPDEIIIVDGGSTDNTLSEISNFKFQISKKNIKILQKRGNRSVGRNEAIKNASGDIIICSDAGNILDRNWIKNIVRPFQTSPRPSPKRRGSFVRVDVVAGYYKGKAKNTFQKCLVPYVLVMPDKVDSENFLPATRSIAFTKKIWEKVGRFDERFSHNEDYVFANRLKEKKAKIVFAKDAVVNWIPRDTFKEAFTMFFRFALGDAEAGILRTNVLLLFARYTLGLYFVFLSVLYKSFLPVIILFVGFVFYILWAIKKNYHYVQDRKAFAILPLLQFTADAAVLSGTVLGGLKKVFQYKYFSSIQQNKLLIFVLAMYSLVLLLTLQWGIPNQNHPFPYHMDEWHQLQAVANTFRFGTPNVFGSANGTMLQFLLSGLYLIPFTLFHIINPFELQLDNWFMRERVFELLRINTIIWGVFSIVTLYKIAKLIGAPKKFSVFLFTFTPAWLMLSGYFKYDIALMFWILLSLFFFLKFGKEPTHKYFLLAAIPAGLAVAVKVSAISLFPIYLLSYFLFRPRKLWDLRYVLAGIVTFCGFILLFGMPDTLLGRGNIGLYLYENLVLIPGSASNFQLGISDLQYLLLHHYPTSFGYGLVTFFVISCFIFISLFIKQSKTIVTKYKIELFLFISLLIFLLSLIPLKLFAAGNRSLVLLPFLSLISSLGWKYMRLKKLWLTIILVLVVGIQLYQSFGWIYMKMVPSPQELASAWVINNIPAGQKIGLENIPIYQEIPDVSQKEFYFGQYKLAYKSRYTYQIIDPKSKELPGVVILTNGEIDSMIYRETPKRDLLERLEREGYKKIAEFSPDFRYYQLFGTQEDYYLSYIAAAPLTISVYRK